MPNTKQQIADAISEQISLDAEAVSEVLTELAELAYASPPDGFVIPGFGTIKTAQEYVRNPGTGEMVPWRKSLEMHFDSVAEEKLLAVTSASSSVEIVPSPPRVLPVISIQYEPLSSDLPAVGNNKTKLGGIPDWIQQAESPTCCGRNMTFYGQIDSAISDDYNIVDAGMLYVFCCDECAQAKSLMQCY